MRYKTADLEWSLLDAAVALAEGDALPDFWRDPDDGTCWEVAGKRQWAPSTRWDQGGPIIDREQISLIQPGYGGSIEWEAGIGARHTDDGWEADHSADGPTPLIAAMRAYISSKFGDEVELP